MYQPDSFPSLPPFFPSPSQERLTQGPVPQSDPAGDIFFSYYIPTSFLKICSQEGGRSLSIHVPQWGKSTLNEATMHFGQLAAPKQTAEG